MTEQEIMQLVEEAGMFALIGPVSHLLHHEIACLQRFASLVAEREREACIVSFEKEADSWVAWPQAGAAKRKGVAAIYARGEKGNEHG